MLVRCLLGEIVGPILERSRRPTEVRVRNWEFSVRQFHPRTILVKRGGDGLGRIHNRGGLPVERGKLEILELMVALSEQEPIDEDLDTR
jgi:hypothetical protein